MKKILLVLIVVVGMTGVAVAQDHLEFKWHGLYSVVDFSYGKNLDTKYDDVMLSQFTAVVGYQHRKETAVGLGVSYVSDESGAYSQLPIFVELRSHYLRTRLTPFTVLRVGYTMPLGESSGGVDAITIKKGGAFFATELGARFAVSRTFGVNVHVGFNMLNMNDVEFQENSVLAENHPVLFYLVNAGLGINF